MINLRSKTHWIFDLDGTLTKPVHDFAYIRSELGLSAGADILASVAAAEGEEQRRLQARLDQLEAYYADQAKPAKGVQACLALLAERGCHFGILTRNIKPLAHQSLAAIGVADLFQDAHVLGRDEAEPKPSPEGIQYLINHWGAEPKHTVMVGDFRFDLEAGRSAGVATVLVNSEGAHWPEHTDLHCFSFDDLLEHLL